MDSAPDTSLGPKSQTKHHHPYFTPAEVELLSEKQRGKLSVTQEERVRQQACTFIEALGSRVGLLVLYYPVCAARYSILICGAQPPEDDRNGPEPVPQISPILPEKRFRIPRQLLFHACDFERADSARRM